MPVAINPDLNLFKPAVATPAPQLAHYHNLLRKWKCGVPISSTPWPLAASHSLLLFSHKEELSARVRQEESNIHYTCHLSSLQFWNKSESSCCLCVANWGEKLIEKKAQTVLCCCLLRYIAFDLIYYGMGLRDQMWLGQSTVSNLLVTYSISALVVSQQMYDVSCLGAFAEKGVYGFLVTSVTSLLRSFNI